MTVLNAGRIKEESMTTHKPVMNGVYLMSERHFDLCDSLYKATVIAAYLIRSLAEKGLKTVIYSLGNKDKTGMYVTELSEELAKQAVNSGDDADDLVTAYSVYVNDDALAAKDVITDYAKHRDACGLVIVVNEGSRPTDDTMEISYRVNKMSDALMFAI